MKARWLLPVLGLLFAFLVMAATCGVKPPDIFIMATSYVTITAEDSDGMIYSDGPDFAVVRETALAGRDNISYDWAGLDIWSGPTYGAYRLYFPFDTGSAIPDESTVVSATLELCSAGTYQSAYGDFAVRVYESPWNAPLTVTLQANWDLAYGAGASYEGVLRDTASGWVSGTCYYLDVEPSRVSVTGATSYTVVSEYDVSGVEPDNPNYVTVWMATAPDTAMRPKLYVAYEGNDATATAAAATANAAATETMAMWQTATAAADPTAAVKTATAAAAGTLTAAAAGTATAHAAETATAIAAGTPTATPGVVGWDGALPRVIWAQTDESLYDCDGADIGLWQCNPDHGPIGSISGFEQFTWEMLNPANGAYDWDLIKDWADKAKTRDVQLDNGIWIDKPVGVRIMLTEATGGSPVIGEDFTPDWVYTLAGVTSQAQWGTGASCTPGTVWYYPQYDNATWRTHYATFVAALGAEFDTNPAYNNIAFFLPCLGASCETYTWYDDAFGGWGCDLAGANGGMSQTFIEWAIGEWATAFPNKIVLFEMTQSKTHYDTFRDLGNDTTGIKCNGLQPPNYVEAEIKHAGYWDGGFSGFSIGTTASEPVPAYLDYPTGGEPGGAGSNVRGGMYWMIMGALSDHFWMLDLQFDLMRKAVADPDVDEFDTLRFARRYLNRTVADTPGVWWVGFNSLLDDREPDTDLCWGSPEICIRAHRGGNEGNDNLEYYLYERRDLNGSESLSIRDSVEMKEWISSAHAYSAFIPVGDESGLHGINRRTQIPAEPYLSFDIDDDLPAAERFPIDDVAHGGTVTWVITVTYADRGTDGWALEYYDYRDLLISKPGCPKADSKTWKDCRFTLTDALFDADTYNEFFLDGADFRINSNSDSDEVIHRIIVEPYAEFLPPPTPNATWTAEARATRTAAAIGTATAEAIARATVYAQLTQTKIAANATALVYAQQTATAAAIQTATEAAKPTLPSNTATEAIKRTQTAAPLATATARVIGTATAAAMQTATASAIYATATALVPVDRTATAVARMTEDQHAYETAIAAQLTATVDAQKTQTAIAYATATGAVPTAVPTATPTPTEICPSSVKIYSREVWGPGVYTVTCRIGVMSGGVLTLRPNTELRFDPFTRLDVYGEFYAIGASAQPITFTSSVSTTAGSWDGIYFGGNAVGQLERAVVNYSYGIQDESWRGAYIKWTDIESNTYGLATAANTTVISSTLALNAVAGLLMKSQAYPSIQTSNIVSNTLYNVWNDQPLYVTIPYCWWGAASPTGADLWDGVDDPRLGIVTRSSNAGAWIDW